MAELGKRISVRWTKERMEKLKLLGWENKKDGNIIDDALEKVLKNE